MDYDEVIPQVICILGLIGVCPGVKITDHSMDNIRETALNHIKEVIDVEKTFKVETKRADKRFLMTSNEISADIGGFILENLAGITVDVKNPDIKLYVELRNDVYIYSKLIKGVGGLPFGSSGKGVSLLSGGIDSPVATFMMAKRGVEVSGVYFHSPPYTSERAKQKVIDLAERLSYFTGSFKLYIVPFTELQLYLLENVPKDKLTIFLKRAMMRVGLHIAKQQGAYGIITGDSVGQVASQTMHAMHAINEVCDMPVYRPLAGMDKQEIIDLAKKIGTFDISIRPYEDCCTIFVAKHPETKPSTKVVNRIEDRLKDLDTHLEKAISNIEIVEI